MNKIGGGLNYKKMQEKYEELKNKYPQLGNAIIFSKLVEKRKMSANEISKWFIKLVPKEDWVGTPKEQIVGFYQKLSNK